MSLSAKREYLMAIRDRYRKATRSEKSYILDEFCAVCGHHRKHAIRLLTKPLTPRTHRRGAKVTYDQDFMKHLVTLWHAMGRICSKRLKAGIPEWLEYYPQPISGEQRKLLLQISPSTIDRKLMPHRKQANGKSTTRRSKWWYKSRIPIQSTEPIEENNPGYIMADTVAHCGESVGGSFVNTLTVTDLGSTWTENRAMWTKNQSEVTAAMSQIENALPFKIKSFKSDSGTEFINQHLYTYFVDRDEPVMFFRTRPYRKNDNCHVEQKNFTHVRVLFGYNRLTDQSIVELMNEIYEGYWNPLQNFFIPSQKISSKKRIGPRIIKTFTDPKTPFQRLMESDEFPQAKKDELKRLKSKLNPFILRLELEQKLNEYCKMTENMTFDTAG